jgi:hypothetical protein
MNFPIACGTVFIKASYCFKKETAGHRNAVSPVLKPMIMAKQFQGISNAFQRQQYKINI